MPPDDLPAVWAALVDSGALAARWLDPASMSAARARIAAVGLGGYREAVPGLVEGFARSELAPICAAAALALEGLGEDARLADHLDAACPAAVKLAVAAIFRHHPDQLHDRLTGGRRGCRHWEVALEEALGRLDGPVDPRLYPFVARLEHHRRAAVQAAASAALRRLARHDPAAVRDARAVAAPTERPRRISDDKARALDHLRAAMAPRRDHLVAIVGALDRLGYAFVDQPIVPPPRDLARRLARIERRAGAVPWALVAFWEVVGGVDLRGTHPDLDGVPTDPLYVVPIQGVAEEVGWWDRADGRFELVLAPDHRWKLDDTGAWGPAVALPKDRPDPRLHGLPGDRRVRLLAWLDEALEHDGLPGLAGVIGRPGRWRRELRAAVERERSP